MARYLFRVGAANRLYLAMAVSVTLVILLSLLLLRPQADRSEAKPTRPVADGPQGQEGRGAHADGDLFVYCAAGMRYAMDEIAANYEREYGVAVQLEYQGSNTLLSQLEVSRTGDLFLAGDASYIQQARSKGLVAESIPIATMRPVIVVPTGNPKEIKGVDDLLKDGVRVALGNPGAAAIGKTTKQLLSASGHWQRLERHVTTGGVFKPTVNDVAVAVQLGSVDAGIVWDSTAAQYPQLEVVRAAELDAGAVQIEIGVVANCPRPTAALRFARYVAARDRGLKIFSSKGFNVVDGDIWEENPEIVFFAGSVNRRALEPVIRKFEKREGVRVNTVYNGCGILTAQMRVMRQKQDSGFPDSYMACDVYYLNTVREMFQDAVNVSDTDIVIAVAKGNPKNIRSLEDLLRPDVRVVLGHPDQCTIGVLSRRLLQDAGIYSRLMAEKFVPMKQTSAMLVPDVITGAADAALAYRTDTRAEADKVDAITIDSPLSKAIQPFAVARSSDHKYLARRLFETIARSRDAFESVGFNWRLPRLTGAVAPDAATKTAASSP